MYKVCLAPDFNEWLDKVINLLILDESCKNWEMFVEHFQNRMVNFSISP